MFNIKGSVNVINELLLLFILSPLSSSIYLFFDPKTSLAQKKNGIRDVDLL